MIQNFADWLVFSIIGLDNETAFGSAVNFFVYDSIKILLLLFLISALMGIVNAYFPVERCVITCPLIGCMDCSICWLLSLER